MAKKTEKNNTSKNNTEKILEKLQQAEDEKQTKKSRSRSWILTQDASKMSFEDLQKALENYTYIGQLEQGKKGGEQGYKHYQIYIENPTQIEFKTLKQKLPNCHIEPRMGTKKQAFDYVTKSDTKIGEVFGNGDIDMSEKQGKRNDIAEIMQMIEDGVSDDEIRKEFPSQFFRYSASIVRARQAILKMKYQDIFRDLTVTYVYGITGKGKTRHVMDKYGYSNVYRITNYQNPFDMYEGQKVIIFEEFRSSLKVEQMLNYLDGYPLVLPARYGDKIACFDTVYIITNIPLSKQYANIQAEQIETYDAFLRRIDFVWNYDTQVEPQKRLKNEKQLKM